MTDMELIMLAEEAGFRAAVIPAKEAFIYRHYNVDDII